MNSCWKGFYPEAVLCLNSLLLPQNNSLCIKKNPKQTERENKLINILLILMFCHSKHYYSVFITAMEGSDRCRA